MVNRTQYTVAQIRAYIQWKKWKHQPDKNWAQKIDLITAEQFYDNCKGIEYPCIAVYNTSCCEYTIKLDEFKTFLTFYRWRLEKTST